MAAAQPLAPHEAHDRLAAALEGDVQGADGDGVGAGDRLQRQAGVAEVRADVAADLAAQRRAPRVARLVRARLDRREQQLERAVAGGLGLGLAERRQLGGQRVEEAHQQPGARARGDRGRCRAGELRAGREHPFARHDQRARGAAPADLVHGGDVLEGECLGVGDEVGPAAGQGRPGVVDEPQVAQRPAGDLRRPRCG